MTSPLLIKNVHILSPARDRNLLGNHYELDPANNKDGIGYLLAQDTEILACELGEAPSELPDGCQIIDGEGKALMPGLVDMHVRIGEPGDEHIETIASAGRAAAAGGVTSILMLPTTNPVIDDIALIDFLHRRGIIECDVKLHPSAALTAGMNAQEMTEIGLLQKEGAKAFYHGPNSISDNVLLKRTMSYARDFDALVMTEINDAGLGSGDMNSGATANHLGLSGIPAEAEIIPLERDMRLVGMTNCRYHAAQVSTKESVDIIRNAKKSGLEVTCSVSINNLTLTQEDIGNYKTYLKLNPPLRGKNDQDALIKGICDGTIDAIVSAHDPHDVDTKRHPFGDATPGAVGLETLLPAALKLAIDDRIPMMNLITALTRRPAEILELKAGYLEAGMPADLCLVDLKQTMNVSADTLHSKSKNTPFEGSQFPASVVGTWVDGVQVFSA